MRKIIAIIIILLFLTGSIPPEKYTDAIHELQRFHTSFTAKERNMEWKVTMKEKIDSTSVKDMVNNDENRHLVTSTFDENRVQYKMENNELKDMEAKVHINHYISEDQAEVIIEISGNQWNTSIAKEYDKFVTHIKQFYISPKAHVFACISATYSATINRNNLEKEIIDTLNLQHVSRVTDPLTDPEKQVVLSGYNSQVEETITIGNEELNTQIVINTRDNEEISLMIGTPIITVEY